MVPPDNSYHIGIIFCRQRVPAKFGLMTDISGALCSAVQCYVSGEHCEYLSYFLKAVCTARTQTCTYSKQYFQQSVTHINTFINDVKMPNQCYNHQRMGNNQQHIARCFSITHTQFQANEAESYHQVLVHLQMKRKMSILKKEPIYYMQITH